jgi:UMF1 family MFS transporter
MYDWANSAMITIIVTAVFPIFFAQVAAEGLESATATRLFTGATTIGLVIIALLSPLLGTVADYSASKLRFLAGFLVMGAIATALMFAITPGAWLFALVLFVLANIGANGSFVFYDALLPHVARQEEMDRVSASGYAVGYLGGGLLLGFALAVIQRPELFGLPAEGTLPVRLMFLVTAVWWIVFSIPLFRRIPEPPPAPRRPEDAGRPAAALAVSKLRETIRELRRYRQAVIMLVAFLIYNDGIGTIIRLATIYGTEIGIDQGAMIAALVVVQFVGIPFAFLFGWLAGRIGAKRAIFIGLAAYVAISVVGYFMRTATHFLILAALVGTVQGGTQALSRSLFASMIPRQKSGEFFGFFSVFEKFAGIFGPAFFLVASLLFGSTRSAILSIVLFFVVGGWLLTRVDVAAGQAQARDEEARLDAIGAHPR